MKTELKVKGMTCGGCEASVTRALSDMDGVSEVQADHTTDSVRMEAEGVDMDAVRTRISELGFEVVA